MSSAADGKDCNGLDWIGLESGGAHFQVFLVIYTSYAMLSSGIPWNIPRVTCILSVQSVFTHVTSGHIRLMKQKKVFT